MSNNINGQTMTMVKQWQWSNNDNGQTMNNGQKEEWSKRRMAQKQYMKGSKITMVNNNNGKQTTIVKQRNGQTEEWPKRRLVKNNNGPNKMVKKELHVTVKIPFTFAKTP